MRVSLFFILPTSLCLGAMGACGDDSSPFDPSNGGDTGGTAPLADAGTVYGLALVNPACGDGDGGTVSDDCTNCTAAECASDFETCFGATWESSLVGGVCSGFGTCVAACDCGDNACFKLCLDELESNFADACRECIVTLIACEQSHCASACDDTTEPDAGHQSDGGGR